LPPPDRISSILALKIAPSPGHTASLRPGAGVYIALSEVQIAHRQPTGVISAVGDRILPSPTSGGLSHRLTAQAMSAGGPDWAAMTAPEQYHQEFTYKNATEGITRALRPYRWGDPIRLVHWRTSARFGDLRIRELEVTLGWPGAGDRPGLAIWLAGMGI
jgi:hypothetical protein